MKKYYYLIRWSLVLFSIYLLTGCFYNEAKNEHVSLDNQEIAEHYRFIYEDAMVNKDEKMLTLDEIDNIRICLGEKGFVAVDSNNQLNMINYEKVMAFDQDVKQGNSSELTILSILESGGFIRFNLETQNGKINVERTTFAWDKQDFQTEYVKKYEAICWTMTEKGYLFWGEAHASGQDNPAGNVAFRVLPLDNELRELNRQYVLSVGYDFTNMMTIDWEIDSFNRVKKYDRRSTSNIPYPEVVDYRLNEDGKLTLIIHAIWPSKYTDQAFCHELTIRPEMDGSVDYLSNKMLSIEDGIEINWYKENSVLQSSTQDAFIFDNEEQKKLKKQAMESIEMCSEFYMEAEIIHSDSEYAYVNMSDEIYENVVKRLGEQGLVSVSKNLNMENYEQVELFYEDYIEGINAEITIYCVKPDGVITAQTFGFRNRELQFYFVAMQWTKDQHFELIGTGVNSLKKILLTDNGYFIYENENIVEHANLREYFRVKPLSEECRQLSEKYISGLSYINYSMLTMDWDKSNVEDILEFQLFEDIYRIHTGENLKVDGGQIPSGMFDSIMMTYFPVTQEQLRKRCGYDLTTDQYDYEMIPEKPYPPFGVVSDYMYNADGTITLYIDCVWPDYDTDCAAINQMVVQPFDDGTFRYLSNRVISYYEQMKKYVEECEAGTESSVVLSSLSKDGELFQREFVFDGSQMYVKGKWKFWDEEGEGVAIESKTDRIETWKYTEKGYFIYTIETSEIPSVSEVIDNVEMIRVKPWNREYYDFAQRYIVPIGYQGNNLLRSNWDTTCMDRLDYNSLFEYFYYLEYGCRYESKNRRENIPGDVFENLMIQYLPVTVKQIRQYAVYDELTETYLWERMGCVSYTPNAFDTSYPEVTRMAENTDGTWTIWIDAVCEKLGTDRRMSHKLTIEIKNNGGIVYLKNEILNDGINYIPEYHNRITDTRE